MSGIPAVHMNFCNECGGSIYFGPVEGDRAPRHVCSRCGHIHYLNPKIVCGCLAIWQDQVLLCRRSIEPRAGFWTLPAGFMENGETTLEGAIRETREEAKADVQVDGLYCLFNIPHISQVYMMFKGTLIEGRHAAGDETLETGLYHEDQIPWNDLAFPVVRQTLQHYFQDRKTNVFPFRMIDLHKPLRP